MSGLKLFGALLGFFLLDSSYAADPAANLPLDSANTSSTNVSVTAKLHLAKNAARLYAHVLVEQSQDKTGYVLVNWLPPRHSFCRKSDYKLNFRGKKFHTNSYRTFVHVMKSKTYTCHGEWRVRVLDQTGSQLAEETMEIAHDAGL